ncbi:hypothetical protein ACJJTC_017780 [Scirpophaga incertulas]
MSNPSTKDYPNKVLETFSFYYKLKFLLASSRVSFSNKCLRPITIYQKIYTVSFLLLFTYSYSNIHQLVSEFYKDRNRNMYLCSVGAAGIHYFAFIFNMIHVRFFNNQANVNFCVELEEIDRSMNIDKFDDLNSILRIFNNITAGLLLMTLICLASITFLDDSFLTTITGVTVTTTEVTCVIELSYYSNLVVFFAIRIRFVNSIIANYYNKSMEDNFYSFYGKNKVRTIAAKNHEFNTCDTDIYLTKIMHGFAEFQKLYQFQFFVLCAKTVVGIIIYFQIVLIGIKADLCGYFEVICIIAFVASNVYVLSYICLGCQIFLDDIAETRQLCIFTLGADNYGPLRRKASMMIKILDTDPPKFSVYGMFNIEARFLLKMFHITTMLMVAQLQFVFLG